MKGKLAIEYFAALVFSSTKLILVKHFQQYLSSSKLLVSLLVVEVLKTSHSHIASQVSHFFTFVKVLETPDVFFCLYTIMF